MFALTKTVHALYRAATVMGSEVGYGAKYYPVKETVVLISSHLNSACHSCPHLKEHIAISVTFLEIFITAVFIKIQSNSDSLFFFLNF